MSNNIKLLNCIKNILKDVRFGIFSNRLSSKQFPDNIDIVNDFNNMLDSLLDREKMLLENQIISNVKTEQLEYIFNMLSDGAMILSENFEILALNSIQTKYFKTKKTKLIGKALDEVLKPYKIVFKTSQKSITDIENFFAQEHKNTVLQIEHNEQKTIFSISIKKLVMPNEIINYFILSHNITPEIKLQELKNTFIATLTHDLKVPILAEKKVLDLLMNNNLQNDVNLYKEALLNMQNNNKDMMNLVNTLLDVYKLESGNFDITRVKTNIVQLVSSEIEKLKFLSEEKHVKFILSSEQKRIISMVDENHFARVIRNVFNNALDYAPENTEILVDIKMVNGKMVISVTDFGCGINKCDLPHIFDRYYTVGKKYRKVGTGLGLYLSKKIIDLHGGKITVNSISNKQTTFIISIPYLK